MNAGWIQATDRILAIFLVASTKYGVSSLDWDGSLLKIEGVEYQDLHFPIRFRLWRLHRLLKKYMKGNVLRIHT